MCRLVNGRAPIGRMKFEILEIRTLVNLPIVVSWMDASVNYYGSVIDYLKPAEPGKSVIGKATCYKVTRNVAFTRAVAYQDDPENVIAHSVGTFMLSTKLGKP